MKSFDRLARPYRALEHLAFGGDLERARVAHVEALASARSILLLGDGDGRFVCALLREAPMAQVVSIDKSPEMIAQARARVEALGMASRVRFEVADARSHEFGSGLYDAVTTLFFLDCFEDSESASLCAAIARSLRPQAQWLFADFVEPRSGWRRLRARLWLWVLYGFFRLTTDLPARRLPDSRRHIEAQGFEAASVRSLQHGLLESILYRKAGPGATAAEAAGP